MKSMECRRENWIDALRAIAMLFVMAGHLLPKSEYAWVYYLFTSPIKIPVFFAISGYLFKDRNGDTICFFENMLKKIIIPWLMLSLIYCIGSIPFKGIHIFFDSIIEVVLGSKFWYMNCLIVAESLFFFLIKYAKKTTTILLGSSALFITGMIMANYHLLDFFMINRAFIAQGFLGIGYGLKKAHWFHYQDKNKLIIISGCAIVFFGIGILSVIIYPGEYLDVHKCYYYNVLICYSMIVAGCVISFWIFKSISSFPDILLFIGRNTLVYFILGSFASSILDRTMDLLSISPSKWIQFSISLFADLFFAGIVAIILNKYFPFIIGKRKE